MNGTEPDPDPEPGPESGAGPDEPRSPDADSGRAEFLLFTYVAPFVGALLLAVGIAGSVVGGYAAVQPALGLCGDPTIAVATPAETERLLDGPTPAPKLPSTAFEELSPAEQAAVREALAAPVREAEVRGAVPNRAAFANGTVVAFRGERYYVTLVAANDCVDVSGLWLPLGLVAAALGVAGVLTPPAYRRLAAFEDRTAGGSRPG